MKSKLSKRIVSLLLAVVMSAGMVLPTFAASTTATGTLKAVLIAYDYTLYVGVTSTGYQAYTKYGASADSLSVSVSVSRKYKSTGKSASSVSSSATGTTSAKVSASAGSTYSFVTATSTHYIKTFAGSVSKRLTATV